MQSFRSFARKSGAVWPCLALFLCLASSARGGDWITAPSYFTHDLATGERLAQFAPLPAVYVVQRDDYQQSGYRHTHSSLRVGGNSDQTHIIEEWGRPVRPYGEWERPFRPYSVPYDLWGPQPIYGPVPYYGHGYAPGYGVAGYPGAGSYGPTHHGGGAPPAPPVPGGPHGHAGYYYGGGQHPSPKP